MSSGSTVSHLLQPGSRVTDWGRMQTATVKHRAEPDNENEVQGLVQYAAANQWKVAVRGVGHSAGGHSFADDALMIDLRRLNRVLELDMHNSRVRVQTGADWAVLTRVLEPAGLAVTTKQEFDTFSIGGSLAANVHGKSVDYGPLIDYVESFRLLLASGEIITVSRTENAELMGLAIGGYGLMGIILDVTLRLVKDRIVRKSEIVYMELAPLIRSYIDRLGRAPIPPLCYGFTNSTCELGYYITYDYSDSTEQMGLNELRRDEPNSTLFNIMVWLQRHSRWLRERSFRATWAASAKPETTLRSRRLLLWDNAPGAFTDLMLQKYFVPINRFTEFAHKAGVIFGRVQDRFPIFLNHFRYVPGNTGSLLSFATQDSICMIPCYLADKDSPAWQQTLKGITNELIQTALDLGGSYYLTFDATASADQFHRAYPRGREFFTLKRKYDPNELFVNQFYQRYANS